MIWICRGAIILAAVAAYANSFSGPFVFLDVPAIVSNPTIRHLWPLGPVLLPPSAGGLAVGGRPLVNLSLAVNHALGGTNVWGYHAFNLIAHILAGLTLFGVVRRTLLRGQGADCAIAPRDSTIRALTPWPVPLYTAFAIALLWTVHPLQTESVTYIIQRAESMMGLFYLLTLYGFIRYAEETVESGKRKAKIEGGDSEGENLKLRGGSKFPLSAFRFPLLSFVACCFGMATKEVMVSAPVIVFLYDRTFVSGSFRGAWRRHRWFFLALAATWIPLAFLVAGTGGNRGGTSGFGIGVSWWDYALTQFPAVVLYLRLALWPHPLDFHYGAQWIHNPASIIPQALIVLALLAATIWALFFTRIYTLRVLGFAGAWFFAILAPTSLVPGMTQTIAEHRMYLALVPVISVVVVGAVSVLGRCLRGRVSTSDIGPRDITSRDPTPLLPVIAIALVFVVLTARRNRVYHSELALWTDTTAKSPWNPYPFNNLGIVLANSGRRDEAIAEYNRALELKPDYAEARNNLGLSLVDAGRVQEAISQYEQALRLKPDYPEAEANLGVALAGAGRTPEAISHLERAVQLDPDYAVAQNDLAVVLAGNGRLSDSLSHYQAVLRLEPLYSEAHYNLANALLGLGRYAEAIAQYETALRLKPDYAEAQANCGVALADSGRFSEAVDHYEAALRLDPKDPDLHHNLALALQSLGRDQEARAEFDAAARLGPR